MPLNDYTDPEAGGFSAHSHHRSKASLLSFIANDFLLFDAR